MRTRRHKFFPDKTKLGVQGLKCKCGASVRLVDTRLEDHDNPEVLKTWSVVDGKNRMIDVRVRCTWSGAMVEFP